VPLFLVTFFAVYGGAHFYLLVRARQALALGAAATAAVAAPLAALVCAPLVVHALSRAGYEAAARAAALVGYFWMAFAFCLFWMHLAADGARLSWRALHLLAGRGAVPFPAPPRTVFLALAAAAAVLCAWGAAEARRVRVERVRIVTEKLPPDRQRLRIAQVSDLHLGLLVRHAAARRTASVLAGLAPDIVVSTGDLVDGQVNRLEGLAEILAAVPAPLGKYAVTGNHEYYAGIVQSLAFARRAGFTVLRGEAVEPGGAVRIAGVDDEAAPGFLGPNVPPPALFAAAALGRQPSPLFTVLLKHRPRPPKEAQGLFDLQLSGHTHGGQIFPFGFVVRRPYPFFRGLYRLEGGGLLWVSRGTGTWGPPVRVGSPPEVTVIDLERPAGRR